MISTEYVMEITFDFAITHGSMTFSEETVMVRQRD